jgi:hypothetical protein
MDLATGERHLVPGDTQVWSTAPGKYYTFKGYSYYMDPDTGERTQYDLSTPVLPQSPNH